MFKTRESPFIFAQGLRYDSPNIKPFESLSAHQDDLSSPSQQRNSAYNVPPLPRSHSGGLTEKLVTPIKHLPALSRSYVNWVLPPRDLADAMVQRFFEQIHCIFWVFHREHFQALYEETYAHKATRAAEQGVMPIDIDEGSEAFSAGWLCVLFTVFALSFDTEESLLFDQAQQVEPAEFFKIANDLVRPVVEAENLMSVRALTLLVSLIVWYHI